ncbi:MAG: PaaI family thioesterase [Terracidiphilus sp.]
MKGSQENLRPMVHSAQNRCFGCGQANSTGMRLEFLLADDGSVVSLPTVGESFEGHPGYLHGGIIATLLDEAMSKSARARGLRTMTRHLEVDYLRPVPSSAPLRIEGRLVKSEGRRHWIEAGILGSDGTVLAQGKGVFVEVKK